MPLLPRLSPLVEKARRSLLVSTSADKLPNLLSLFQQETGSSLESVHLWPGCEEAMPAALLTVKHQFAAQLSDYLHSGSKIFPNTLSKTLPAFPLYTRISPLMKNDCLNENFPEVHINAKRQLLEPELIKRLLFCHALESQLHVLDACVRVIPFGSSVNGLGSGHSDLDVFVGSPDRNSLTSLKTLGKTRKILFKHDSQSLKDSALLLNTRVPILHIKLHRLLGFGLDISQQNKIRSWTNSVATVAWQRRLVALDEAIPDSIKLLKSLLHKHGFLGPGPGRVFSSWKIISLYLHFLQARGHVPPIAQLLPTDASEDVYKIWDEGLDMAVGGTDSGENHAWRLLQEFFMYVSQMQPSCEGYCLLTGQILQKNNLQTEAFLYMPDPCEPESNITRGVDQFHWMNFLSLVKRLLQTWERTAPAGLDDSPVMADSSRF